jgi:endonuclease/exonuclease/phosphatase family metal-dependent hydrolase
MADLVISLRGQKNFRHKKDSAVNRRMSDFKNFVIEQRPEIVCLQEFFSEGTPIYSPIERLRKDMGFSNYYFESYYQPGPRNRLTGLLIFSKYTSVNKGKYKLEEEGSETFAIFNDLIIGDDTVRVFNIHMASIRLQPEDIDFVVNAGQENEKDVKGHASRIYTKLKEAFLLREKQMILLKQVLQDSPYHVILAGDFNDTPSSYVYGQITGLLQDTFKEKGKGLGATFADRLPFLRIDYIMKCSHFKTLQYARYQTDYSDHYPVSAVLTER